MKSKHIFRAYKKYNQSKPLLALSLSLLLITLPLNALPIGAQVAAGSVQISQNAKNMLINASNRAIINYKSFNIGLKEGVRFLQPSSNSVVLNRVIQANPSSILGSLNANGKVFLVNPAGIFFGANSAINANSFIATTLNIKDSDFLNGNYQFNQIKNRANSYIIQKGSISVSNNGFVVLASPFVSNQGEIIAKSGHIVIGATDNYYMQFDPSGFIKYDYKPMQQNDKPIVISKDHANSIVDSVLNTDSLQNAIKIVKNGDKIELQGASGTAMVSGSLNTDASNSGKAGSIEVKAQKNAFILNNAKLQTNAQNSGNGGKINIYANHLTYSGKKVSYIAKGGKISGDGGFTEVSAKGRVLLNGGMINLSSNYGKDGTFLVDPTDLQINKDVTMTGSYTANADNSIVLLAGIVISTNGGNIDFNAPSISLQTNSELLAGTGDITLNAIQTDHTIINQASSNILLDGATLKGNSVKITSTATSDNEFYDPDGSLSVGSRALTFLANSPVSPVGYSHSDALSTIDIKNGSNIEANSININSTANAASKVFTVFKGVAAGWGESTAKAYTTIEKGATLNAKNDISIGSTINSSNKVSAYTVNLGGSRGAKANLTLGYAHSVVDSKTQIQNGATLTSQQGDITINSTVDKSISSSALAGSYDDGTLGAGVAITSSTSNSVTEAGGTLNAKNLYIDATTNNNLVKTAASAAVGSGFVSGRIVKAANVALNQLSKFTSKVPAARSGSSSTGTAISAAFSYSKHSTTTKAYLASNSNANIAQDTQIHSTTNYPMDNINGAKGIKSSAIATVDSNKDASKDKSVAGALLFSDISNYTEAFIGQNAVLNSGGDIDLFAKTYLPYEILWANIQGVGDITDKINSNAGIQNGFFTTWAQSNSKGKKVGLAGSVNIFHLTNNTNSYVDNSAQINQRIASYGKMRVIAQNDVQTLNLSGVFGLKGAGSSGGKGGVGGSYLDILYNDTATAKVKNGSKIKASSFSAIADSSTKNISIAEAGAMSGKYGVAGSLSYLRTNDTTSATVDGATIDTTLGAVDNRFYKGGRNSNLLVEANNYAKIFNLGGGVAKAKNVGIGVSVSLNEINRNTLASIENSQIATKGQNYIYALNSGVIDAYSLAAAIAAPGAPTPDASSAPNGAGNFGIGVSGDVSINTISDDADAHIKNTTLTNQNSNLNIKAKNSSEIKSFTGSAAITTSSKSVGLAGSYSQNSITDSAQSYIDSSTATANKVSLSASNDNDIQSASISGSAAPTSNSGSIAGSVSINSVAATTKAYIQNSSDITANSDVTLSSDDTSSIKALAGAVSVGGKAGIGASFAKNNITDTILSYLSSSDLSSKGDLKITSVFSGSIKLLATSAGAALSGMAAGISVSLNNIANDITSYIDGKKTSAGIHADGNTQVSSDDTSNINIISGGISGASAASIGASVLYNVIKNTLLSYLNNTDISTNGNMIVRAKSDKTIQAISVGGAGAGDVSLAGSVVINTIKNHTSSYISGTQANIGGTLSLSAIDNSAISNYGGTGSGAGTVGIGGTAIVNNIQNSILAYINNNSIINALGNDFLSVLSGNENGDKEDVRGLDIFASGRSNIENYEGTIGIGGTGSLAATVSTNIIKNIISAYIDNSQINQASNANSLQDARVRSFAYTNLYNIIGAVALSGDAGIGASVDTSIIKNSTKSYITDNSNIKANNLIQVKSDGLERLNAIAASGAGSTVALAGSVETIILDNTNEAYVQNSLLSSNKDLDVLSNDSSIYGTKKDGTKSGIIAGGIQGSVAASLGGAVFVNSAKHTVKAYVDNSTLNAKGSTNIKTNSSFDVLSYITNIGVSAGVSLSASVVVNGLQALSQAYTTGSTNINQDDSFKTSSQNVDITGKSSSAVDTTVGSVSAGLVGVGGSVNVTNIKDTVLAQIGSGNKVDAGGALLVNADSSKTVQDKVGAFSAGLGGVAGAVSITNINKALNGDQVNSYDNTKSQSNTIVSKDNVKGRVGDTSQANEADSDIQSNTPTNIDGAFSTTQPSSSTFANIANNAIINTGLDTTVQAADTVKYQSLTGALGAGIVGAGGAVGIGEIGSNTQAFINRGVKLDTRNLYVTSEFNVNDTNIKSYAAAAGLVGLGAAVSQLYIKDYTTLAFIGANSLINSSGSINIKSETNPTVYTKALGAAVGATAVGVVMSKTNINGTTGTYIGTNSHLSANGNIALNSVFDTPSTISSLSQAAAGGIYSRAGSVSTTDISPYIFTTLQDYVALYTLGNINLTSIGNGALSSNAEGVSIGELTVGISDAKSYWTPVIYTNIQNHVQLNSNNLFANAFENTDTLGNYKESNEIKSSSFSAAGALVGGSGSSSYAKSNAVVKVNIGNSNTITTNLDSNFQAKSFSNTVTNSSGNNYGVLAAGSTHAKSENYSDTAVNTGTQNKIESTNSDLNMYSYSKIKASASTTGGAGGLIAGAGTLSKVDITNNSNINIGKNNNLYAKKGDINLNAQGYIDTSADTSITTAGGITINESESNININQNIGVTVNNLSQLEAKNININAKSLYLHAVLSSLSHTIAANSTSKAYSILNVNSNAKINIKPQARLTGYNSVNINALQNNVYFSTYAKVEIKAGLTGTTYAKVKNNPTINSNVNVESGSNIYTRNLNIKSSAPDKSKNIYKLNAEAKSNTVVYWVLTTVDKLVKKVSHIPIIGWFVKWVWHKVKEWVKHILHSDASSDMLGKYVSNGDISLNGNVYQLSSSPQRLSIAPDGTISSQGSISANVGTNNIVVNDIINHDIGKITLDASDQLSGNANIYLSNSYPSIDITNQTNKNLLINKITMISDNANKPNLEIFTNNGGDLSNFNIQPVVLPHTINIQNSGNGNIVFNNLVDNYGGDTTVANSYGSILANNGALIKSKNVNFISQRGSIGLLNAPLEVELTKSNSENPTVNIDSFRSIYFGLKLSQLLNSQPASNYTIDKAVLNNIHANGKIGITLHTPTYTYYDAVADDFVKVNTQALYAINNIYSNDDIAVNGEAGNSILFDGTMQSGQKDLGIVINNTDPSITTSEYIRSITPNDIYLNPITTRGGHISINLNKGLFSGGGTATVLNGHMHLNIQNNTPKNLNTDYIKMGEITNGSFIVNGVPKSFNTTGYSNGAVDIQNLQGRNINIGSSSSPVNLTGEITAQTSGNVFINSLNDLALSKITGSDVFIQSDKNILDLSQNIPTVSANNLVLNAVNDIGSDNAPLTISSNLLNARSSIGSINMASNNNIIIDSIQTPNKLTLSTNGGIYQNGGSATDITANEVLLKAKNGIGDDGTNEKGIDTKVNILDAYNQNANNLVISNEGNLLAGDLDADGYALYNGGGDIKVTTSGDFTQQANTVVLSKRDISVSSIGDIFAVNLKATRDISLESTNGNILAKSEVAPNLSGGRKITLLAYNGFVGTPQNIIDIQEGTQGVHIATKDAEDFLSVYIRGVVSPTNFYTDPELATFNNRPISGTKIEEFLQSIYNNSAQRYKNMRQLFFIPITPAKKAEKIVQLF